MLYTDFFSIFRAHIYCIYNIFHFRLRTLTNLLKTPCLNLRCQPLDCPLELMATYPLVAFFITCLWIHAFFVNFYFFKYVVLCYGLTCNHIAYISTWLLGIRRSFKYIPTFFLKKKCLCSFLLCVGIFRLLFPLFSDLSSFF